MSNSISVIAGNGDLPLKVLKNLRSRGIEADVIGIKGEYKEAIKEYSRRFETIEFYEIEKGLEYLRIFSNKDVVFVGGVKKVKLIDMFRPDVVKRLIRIRDFSDENIFKGIINILGKNGFNVVSFTRFYEEGLVKEGVICGKIPDSGKLRDALYGMNFVKHNSKYSIGQSVIVKNENIVAIETIFGTDYMLKSYLDRLLGDVIFVKCSKKTQDDRIDLPSIGKNTIDLLSKACIKWVFMEAFRSIIIGDEETISYAIKKGINICGIKLE